jgi:hypothetical protein
MKSNSTGTKVAPTSLLHHHLKTAVDLERITSDRIRAVIERERLLNDLSNTGVATALVGGFALGSLDIDRGAIVYMLALMAVHLCTCSALTSALCFRTINMMSDQDAVVWAKKKKCPIGILQIPLLKFGAGTICYVSSVMVRSYNELSILEDGGGGFPGIRWWGSSLGAGSVMMMIMAAVMLYCTGPNSAKKMT